MLLERLVLLFVTTAVLAAAYLLWQCLQRYRLARHAQTAPPSELAALVPPGRPTLLYFTTPDCAQCRLRQAPILRQLANLAGVSIQTLDAVQHDGLARFFGIMTVPTTVWLDAQRRPVAVNHGLATLDQLQRQWSAARNG
jgi:thioredoxin 1